MAKLNEVEKSIIFDENLDPILVTEVIVSQDLMLMNTIELKGIRINIDDDTNEIKNGKEIMMLVSFNIEEIVEVGIDG